MTINVAASIDMQLSNNHLVHPPAGGYLPGGHSFFDDFDYDVPLSFGGSNVNGADNNFVNTGGWDLVKSINVSDQAGARGNLSTAISIPGYSGQMPSLSGSDRVLRAEQLSASLSNQTDFYLQLGDGLNDLTLSADVWIQFWIYAQNAAPETGHLGVAPIHYAKFLYPTQSGHGSVSRAQWLLSVRNNPTYGPEGNYYVDDEQHKLIFYNFGPYSEGGAGGQRYHYAHPGQQYDTDQFPQDAWAGGEPTPRVNQNGWYLCRFHMNSTLNGQRAYEQWLRPMGDQNFVKVAEWLGGQNKEGYLVSIDAAESPQVPGFYGHHGFRLFTTFGTAPQGANNRDSVMYMSDLAIVPGTDDGGVGVAGLPVYPGY